MKPLNSFGQLLCRTCFSALLLAGSAQAEFTPYPDNDARAAILKERQRIDAIRTESEAIRREMDTIRRELDKERQRIDLMLRKVDDELRPVSESVKKGIDELELLKNAQMDLLGQLEDARKEASARSGATILLQTQLEQSRREVRELRGKTEELEVQMRELRKKIEFK